MGRRDGDGGAGGGGRNGVGVGGGGGGRGEERETKMEGSSWWRRKRKKDKRMGGDGGEKKREWGAGEEENEEGKRGGKKKKGRSGEVREEGSEAKEGGGRRRRESVDPEGGKLGVRRGRGGCCNCAVREAGCYPGIRAAAYRGRRGAIRFRSGNQRFWRKEKRETGGTGRGRTRDGEIAHCNGRRENARTEVGRL